MEGVGIGPVATSTLIDLLAPLLWRVNVTELACWLATAWTPFVLVPGTTKLRSSVQVSTGAFTVLSNMRPSSDSRRGRSLAGMGGTFLGSGRGAFVQNTLIASVGLTNDLKQDVWG